MGYFSWKMAVFYFLMFTLLASTVRLSVVMIVVFAFLIGVLDDCWVA